MILLLRRYNTLVQSSAVSTECNTENAYRRFPWDWILPVQGLLPPYEFLPQVQFGLDFMALERQDYKTASMLLESVVDRYPRSHSAPKARYWCGVSEYKASHKVNALLNAWRKIRKDYAHSIWVKKVSFVKNRCLTFPSSQSLGGLLKVGYNG